MRYGWMLAIGLAGVLLGATSAAACGGFVLSTGVGVPMHPGMVAPRVLVAPPSFVTVLPSGFVLPATILRTPQVIIAPRTPVIVTIVPARGFPPPIAVAPPARVTSPVLAPAPPVRVTPPVVIVVTPQKARGR